MDLKERRIHSSELLKHRVREVKDFQSTSKEELCKALQEAWNSFLEEAMRACQRLQTGLKNKAAHNKHLEFKFCSCLHVCMFQ